MDDVVALVAALLEDHLDKPQTGHARGLGMPNPAALLEERPPTAHPAARRPPTRASRPRGELAAAALPLSVPRDDTAQIGGLRGGKFKQGGLLRTHEVVGQGPG